MGILVGGGGAVGYGVGPSRHRCSRTVHLTQTITRALVPDGIPAGTKWSRAILPPLSVEVKFRLCLGPRPMMTWRELSRFWQQMPFVELIRLLAYQDLIYVLPNKDPISGIGSERNVLRWTARALCIRLFVPVLAQIQESAIRKHF